MIVTASIDLSESGDKPALPEEPTTVLIFASEEHDIDGALAAIGRCRLIREGHAFNTEIHHAMSLFALRVSEWELGEDGEVWTREPVQIAEHFHPGEFDGCREDHREDHRP